MKLYFKTRQAARSFKQAYKGSKIASVVKAENNAQAWAVQFK